VDTKIPRNPKVNIEENQRNPDVETSPISPPPVLFSSQVNEKADGRAGTHTVPPPSFAVEVPGATANWFPRELIPVRLDLAD
jgi:hypothetical protein